MNKNQKFGIIDEIEWVHKDKNGKVIKRYKSNTRWNRLLRGLHLKRHECIVADGMANVAGLLLLDIGGTAYDYIGIGTGTTPADVADTQLQTQRGVKQAAVGTRITTTQTNDTAQLVATFSQAIDSTLTGTDNISEVGVFALTETSPSEVWSMLWRQTFIAESLNWDAGDTFEMTCKTQIKQGS